MELDNLQRNLLLHTPNIPDETTPIGQSEDDNPTVKTWGKPTEFSFTPLAHWDLCEKHNIVDFERGVKLAEAVCADALISKVIADIFQDVLDIAGANGKDTLIFRNSMPQTIIFNVLVEDGWDRKQSHLPCFLLDNIQTIAVSIPYNIG